MKPVPFHDLVTCLTADQTPRVWSLLVTVFGELAQDEGSKISGALLGKLTALMGIKPEAMRVALHRLRKDGWIDSEADGRRRTHFLTAWGRAQSAAATPRIYSLQAVTDPPFMVVCNPVATAPETAPHSAWVATNIAVTTVPDRFADAYAAPLTTAAGLPDWLRGKVCPTDTDQLTTSFATQLRALELMAPPPETLTPHEIAALRVLIVHGWRRIALRTPALPDFVFADHWAGGACRDAVAALLSNYPRQQLDPLEAALG